MNQMKKERIINTEIPKIIFINNPDILAKLISDITKIPYPKLKNNIFITTNIIPIERFKEYDFIIKISNISKLTPYTLNVYSHSFICQINLNTFNNNNYLDIFELQNNKGIKYIENFKIYTLDIKTCHNLYHNQNKNNNIIKWGAFLYSKKNKNITKIISDIVNEKELKNILKEL